MNERPPFDDLGAPIPGTDFDYDAVQLALDGKRELPLKCDSACPLKDVLAKEMAVQSMGRVWRWIYGPQCDDLEGFFCRCIVASWAFVPGLQSTYDEAEIARRFGKKKQSINRFVMSFQAEFPKVLKHKTSSNRKQK